MRYSLYKTKDGVLCGPHKTSGAPVHHHPGCVMCEAARAKGIIRPDVPKHGDTARQAQLLVRKRVDRERLLSQHAARRNYMATIPFPRESPC
jgi:hypothetical protein